MRIRSCNIRFDQPSFYAQPYLYSVPRGIKPIEAGKTGDDLKKDDFLPLKGAFVCTDFTIMGKHGCRGNFYIL